MSPSARASRQVVISEDHFTEAHRKHIAQLTDLPLNVIEEFQAGVVLFALLAMPEDCRVAYALFFVRMDTQPRVLDAAVTFVSDWSPSGFAAGIGLAVRMGRALHGAVNLPALPEAHRRHLNVAWHLLTPRCNAY